MRVSSLRIALTAMAEIPILVSPLVSIGIMGWMYSRCMVSSFSSARSGRILVAIFASCVPNGSSSRVVVMLKMVWVFAI